MNYATIFSKNIKNNFISRLNSIQHPIRINAVMQLADYYFDLCLHKTKQGFLTATQRHSELFYLLAYRQSFLSVQSIQVFTVRDIYMALDQI